jgi:pimeloyl-ACP methyl ester carboxylesterase
VKIKPNHPAKPLAVENADIPAVAIVKGPKLMNTLKIGAALAGLLAMGATTAAYASTAHNIVLVPGAFTDKSSWDKVARLLRAKGFKVTEVDIPMTSLESDVAATRKALEAQNGATVLVGHSWGGVVIGEVGDSPKVKSLVYVAAFAPDKGESVQALSANGPPTEGLKAVHPDAQGFLSIDPAAFPHVFVGDVPTSEGAELAKKQKPISGAAFGAKATVAAWRLKPTYYAISANDLMLPPQAEAFFAERMKATTVTLQSSHASPVSHPNDVAALIKRAAKGD